MSATADRDVRIEVAQVALDGRLSVPAAARGAVIFAHGSGSGRLSPRNRAVAAGLNDVGFATLLFDLLTNDEEAVRSNVFDIPMLGARLAAVTGWLQGQAEIEGLRLGYFGASTGAAAALWAAAELGEAISAVVSRGGRPDLAAARLSHVTAATLMVVGGNDPVVLELNQAASGHLRSTTQLVVVPGAGHLFEEPGALQIVVEHARDWFVAHL